LKIPGTKNLLSFFILTGHMPETNIIVSPVERILIMLKYLALDKPIAFIEVETTGLKPDSDRIVELSVYKIYPNGKREYKSHRINP
jgi:hypothetical protein